MTIKKKLTNYTGLSVSATWSWPGLKKSLSPLDHRERANLVESSNPNLPLGRQAELLDISRSSLYYKPVPVSDEDIDLMNKIDAIYTKCPFYGARQMKRALWREHKIRVGRPKVRRLMAEMGLEAIYPKPKLSKRDKQHPIYPYLLKNLSIDHPNQVWALILPTLS